MKKNKKIPKGELAELVAEFEALLGLNVELFGWSVLFDTCLRLAHQRRDVRAHGIMIAAIDYLATVDSTGWLTVRRLATHECLEDREKQASVFGDFPFFADVGGIDPHHGIFGKR